MEKLIDTEYSMNCSEKYPDMNGLYPGWDGISEENADLIESFSRNLKRVPKEEVMISLADAVKYFSEKLDGNVQLGRKQVVIYRYAINALKDYMNKPFADDWTPSLGFCPCTDEVTNFWVTIRRKSMSADETVVRKMVWYPEIEKWKDENGEELSDMYEIVAWREYREPAPYAG